jgi:acetyl-CoA carboxylase biotin carboxyl carrier protein
VSLTAAEVAEIMRLVEKSGFDELLLEIDGTKLIVKRGAIAQSASSLHGPSDAQDPAKIAVGPATHTDGSPLVVADPNLFAVPAPLLGTFYRSPKPGEPPFVVPGSEVQEETVVGIIEVMKLMNSVRAGVRGTVVEIPIVDGSLVEYGETLLRIRKAG